MFSNFGSTVCLESVDESVKVVALCFFKVKQFYMVSLGFHKCQEVLVVKFWSTVCSENVDESVELVTLFFT